MVDLIQDPALEQLLVAHSHLFSVVYFFIAFIYVTNQGGEGNKE